MTDKTDLQKELEEISKKVQQEENELKDVTIEIISDHAGYELLDKSAAEVLDDKYRERYFPIMIYQPIERYKKKKKKDTLASKSGFC